MHLTPTIDILTGWCGAQRSSLIRIVPLVIPDLWPQTVWCRLLKKYGDSLVVEPTNETRSWDLRSWVVPLLAVAVAFLLQVTHAPVPAIGHGWTNINVNDGYKPLDITEPLQNYAREKGPNARVFNDANLGGYLIYFVPELKIYMDDRFELYGNEWTQNYIAMMHEYPARIEAVMDRYDLELAVIPTLPVAQPIELRLSYAMPNCASASSTVSATRRISRFFCLSTPSVTQWSRKASMGV